MRPRVDLTCRYTRLPNPPSPGFPDQHEIWFPVLDVILVSGGGRFHTVGLLDTGASITLFSTQAAEALGIDWRSSPQVPICGVGGQDTGYAADVAIVIPAAGYSWPARVVFSPALDRAPLPLLGQNGFFEHFEVRFKTSVRQFKVFLR